MAALEYAKDKIMMGAERKSAILSVDTIKMTAFHEAGHALVALKTDGSDPIHKATVMPRGRALGMVMQLPDGDQTSMTRKQMLARMDVAMGGRVAEELIYGAEYVTSGASSDIQAATRIAYAMVSKFGFSEKIGIMFIDDKATYVSPETKQFVDEEVRLLLKASYLRATKCIESNRKELDIIANGLIQYESLSGGEIVDLIAGKAPSVGSGLVRSQRPSRAAKVLPLTSSASRKAAVSPPPSSSAIKPSPSSAALLAPVQPTRRSPQPSKPTAAAPDSTGSAAAVSPPVPPKKAAARGPPTD